MRKKWSSEKLVQLVEARLLGHTQAELGVMFGCSHTTIYRALNDARELGLLGDKPGDRAPGREPACWRLKEEEVRRLYWEQGLALRKTAVELDVPKEVLCYFMRKHGIPRRPPYRRPKAEA